ncbi:MAG: hypothetical protein Q7T03_06280 [Deltaproteobacteria bacterium]|nr:hypothetical protein [Deltaproteobacteria bacterium]
MTLNTLLGIPLPLLQGPAMVASTLDQIPSQAVGEELVILGDVFECVDAQAGAIFQRGISRFQLSRRDGIETGVSEGLQLMRSGLLFVDDRNWRRIVKRYQKHPAVLDEKKMTPVYFSAQSISEIKGRVEIKLRLNDPLAPPLHFSFEGEWKEEDLLSVSQNILDAASPSGENSYIAAIFLESEQQQIFLKIGVDPFGVRQLFCTRLSFGNKDGMEEWDAIISRNSRIYFASSLDGNAPFVSRRDKEKNIFNNDRDQRAGILNNVKNHPDWFRWLTVPEGECGEIEINQTEAREIQISLEHRFRELVEGLHCIFREDSFDLGPKGTEWAKEFHEAFRAIGVWPAFPKMPGNPVSENGLRRLARLLMEVKKEGPLSKDNITASLHHLAELLFISREYFSILKGRLPVLKFSFWNRSEKGDHPLLFSEKQRNDLSTQVLLIRAPNGMIVGAFSLRFVVDVYDQGAILWDPLFLPHFAAAWMDESFWGEKVVQGVVSHIAERTHLGGRFVIRQERSIDVGWTSGFSPLSAHPAAKNAGQVAEVQTKNIPRQFFYRNRVSCEALKPLRESQMAVFNPWSGLNQNAIGLQDLLKSEIEPNPDPKQAEKYRYGISVDTGRSVCFHYPHVSPDGTQWNYLSGVGVGRTQKARTGVEPRDGLTSMDEALPRYYMSNMMHAVAGPLGFRTPLALGIVDAMQWREGHVTLSGLPQKRALYWELSRLAFRLSDLEHAKYPEQLIDYAKQNVAAELGKRKMTRRQYIQWMAETLGEQLAIMMHFGFDHGRGEGRLQLYSWNVGLAIEMVDWETGSVRRRNLESLQDDYLFKNEMSLVKIEKMEKEWRSESRKKNWLSVLLEMAPDLFFSSLMRNALNAKLKELQMVAKDPKKLIDQFNQERWNAHYGRNRFSSFLPRSLSELTDAFLASV